MSNSINSGYIYEPTFYSTYLMVKSRVRNGKGIEFSVGCYSFGLLNLITQEQITYSSRGTGNIEVQARHMKTFLSSGAVSQDWPVQPKMGHPPSFLGVPVVLSTYIRNALSKMKLGYGTSPKVTARNNSSSSVSRVQA